MTPMDNVLQIILPTDIGNEVMDFLAPYVRTGSRLKSSYLVEVYDLKTGKQLKDKGVILQVEFEGIDDEA